MSAAEDRALVDIEAWVEKKLGLHFDEEQRPAMRSRLRGLVRRLGLRSPEEVMARLRSDEGALPAALAETVATHHTGFFREAEVLGRLDREIIPTLPESRERHRIWSAAASTGEEAYSVGIFLAERYGVQEAQKKFSILGTDLVQKVVRTAERAEYGKAPMRSVSAERRSRWFEPSGEERHRVKEEVRSLCTFRRLNLVREPWPFNKKFSVILCRNVLYYFDKPIRARILSRMYEACEPGGWLVTSVSESLHELRTSWETVASGVHRRQG